MQPSPLITAFVLASATHGGCFLPVSHRTAQSNAAEAANMIRRWKVKMKPDCTNGKPQSMIDKYSVTTVYMYDYPA